MTPKDLADALALADAATEGPWLEDDGNVFSGPLSAQRMALIMRLVDGEKDVPHPDQGSDQPMGFVCTTTQDQPNFIADATFIAAARTLVPQLIAEIFRLQGGP